VSRSTSVSLENMTARYPATLSTVFPLHPPSTRQKTKHDPFPFVAFMCMVDRIVSLRVCKEWARVLCPSVNRIEEIHVAFRREWIADFKTHRILKTHWQKNKTRMMSPTNRQVLVEWMYDLHRDFDFDMCTFFCMVRYFDLFLALSSTTHTVQSYQVIAAACTWLAAKFHDNDDSRTAPRLVWLSANAFTLQALLDMEKIVWHTLNGQLFVATVWSSLTLLLDAFPLSQEAVRCCENLAYRVQWTVRSTLYTCVRLAAAIYSEAALVHGCSSQDAVTFSRCNAQELRWCQKLVIQTRYETTNPRMKRLDRDYESVTSTPPSLPVRRESLHKHLATKESPSSVQKRFFDVVHCFSPTRPIDVCSASDCLLDVEAPLRDVMVDVPLLGTGSRPATHAAYVNKLTKCFRRQGLG
jgi:hypothetical protein